MNPLPAVPFAPPFEGPFARPLGGPAALASESRIVSAERRSRPLTGNDIYSHPEAVRR